MNDVFSDLILVILGFILCVVFIPIGVGIMVGFFIGATGLYYFGIIITVSLIIWLLLYLLWWKGF